MTMKQQRRHLLLNAGNLLELAGAALAVYAVVLLAGVAWGLLLAGVLLVVAAELIFDERVWRLPLPHRPALRFRALRADVRERRWRRWAERTSR
jgi:hypothetical protein